jgi:hypothetical protein
VEPHDGGCTPAPPQDFGDILPRDCPFGYDRLARRPLDLEFELFPTTLVLEHVCDVLGRLFHHQLEIGPELRPPDSFLVKVDDEAAEGSSVRAQALDHLGGLFLSAPGAEAGLPLALEERLVEPKLILVELVEVVPGVDPDVMIFIPQGFLNLVDVELTFFEQSILLFGGELIPAGRVDSAPEELVDDYAEALRDLLVEDQAAFGRRPRAFPSSPLRGFGPG